MKKDQDARPVHHPSQRSPQDTVLVSSTVDRL